MPLTQNAIDNAKNLMKQTNEKSGALFQGCIFGNAFTEEEEFIGVGEGRRGEEVSDDMYWRWASMSKICGLAFLGLALEEGLINLDDPVSKYISEFSNINSYISNAIPVPGKVDKYGTPVFEMVTTTEEGLGNKITIRHLVTMQSGLGFTFWGLGSTRNLLNAFASVPSGQRMISYIQYWDKLYNTGNTLSDVATTYYYKNPASITELILERTKHPLLCYPGTDTIYGNDPTIYCAAIGRSIQSKGWTCTPAQYCQWKIFLPLGMDSTWLRAGGLNPPNDVLEKITDAYFVRQSGIDGQQGQNVQLNKTYRCLDADAQGDGFAFQLLNLNLISQKQPPISDPLTGGLSGDGVGKLSDLAKLLKLFINQGKYKTVDENGNEMLVELLKEQTVKFLLSSKVLSPTLWAFGLNADNLISPYEIWTGGMAKVNDLQSPGIPFGFGANVYTWNGYFGTTFIFDTDTGNYIISGTQVSKASWQLTTLPDGKPPTLGFQVDAIKLFQILTSNFNGNY
jgi:CubicO group peptidase (beta-lactamase class C family)